MLSLTPQTPWALLRASRILLPALEMAFKEILCCQGLPMAAPKSHQGHALQVSLRQGGLRLLHHPHLSQRPGQLHAVQEKPKHQFEESGAAADAETGGTDVANITILMCTAVAFILHEFASGP